MLCDGTWNLLQQEVRDSDIVSAFFKQMVGFNSQW